MTLTLNGWDRLLIEGDATTRPLEFDGIELRVTDAWGNTANLSRTFFVVPVESAVNNTDNGTETDDTGNDTDNTHTDDSTLKIVGILLLVPIAIFIALLWVVKVRER